MHRSPETNSAMAEGFQPIAVRAPSENPWLFRARCGIDLQLLTIVHFLRDPLAACHGRVPDVGAGAAPWRDFLPADVEYLGVDIGSAADFGMRLRPDIVYYDGNTLPFGNGSFDQVLCVEVLEHLPDPTAFLAEIKRVVKAGGKLILTIPWSARLHHLPHDYGRFTRIGLSRVLISAGFINVRIFERGNDIAVIANKLTVLSLRLLRPKYLRQCVWAWPLALMVAPMTIAFLVAAYFALWLKLGSAEDPLGYGAIATAPALDR